MKYYFFLFFLLIEKFQHDILFCQKKQVRNSDCIFNKEWHLKLKENRGFEYIITQSTITRNNQHIKNDTLSFNGFWDLKDDTIILHSEQLTNYCKKEVVYVKKGDALLSLGARVDSIYNLRIDKLNFISSRQGKKNM